MKRAFSPFPIAAPAGVLALVGLLAYGLSQNEPDRGIESAIARGEANVLGEYGVIAYPETFVINRRGRIVASRRGPVDDAFMRREVAPLLEPS